MARQSDTFIIIIIDIIIQASIIYIAINDLAVSFFVVAVIVK